MKVVALVSGGKDSCYAIMKCLQYGHEIVALANLLPADDAVDELDSYMYQTVGHQIVVSYARCMGLPLFRRRLQGSSRHLDLGYRITPGDEVEDLFILLSEIKRQIPSISAVSSGAIASDYQRLRVENVCSRLGLVSLAYLWKQDQRVLLEEMIKDGILAILVKVAAIGLDPSKHLGKELAYMSPHLHHLNKLYGSNICGEGGEYETLTLDCPLFKFARIVLDEFQVVLHSPESIAPVGVLHPSAFHLEEKEFSDSTNKSMILNGVSSDELNHVFEVLGDSQQLHIDNSKPLEVVSDTNDTSTINVQISRKGTSSTLSISCWMQNPPISSGYLQGDLKSILLKVESQLKECSFGWEDALYIHLYIADMNQFPVANETYVSFVTQDRCPFGVPSRSTIELPLLQVGLGRAYIEVLVAKQQTKRVLHVQSISCWAPSCIGPYSQATLYKGILHMAGQLGLDPPTMTLSAKDPTIELKQALLNSEAIAESFHCSISTSTICFVIYCSVQVKLQERIKIQREMNTFLNELRASHSNKRNVPQIDDPLILFVLVPALPKSALVEVKPLLYIKEEIEIDDENVEAEDCVVHQNYWGFGPKSWHDLCLQKCNVLGKLFAAILCVTDNLAAKISEDCVGTVQKAEGCQDAISEKLMEKVVKYCIYLLDRMLMESLFSWNDAMYLRIYFKSTSISSMEKLSTLFTSSFLEFAEMNPTFDFGHEPIFTLIPVLGSGRSGDSADAVITCEILAQKP